MRFLQSEYKSIVATLLANSHSEDEFSFTKKRGKLWITHLASNNQFFFFRNTTTILNADRQWEKKSEYKFGEKKEEFDAEDFDTVLSVFKNWLKKLPMN